MSEVFTSIEELAEDARDYINTRIEVIKLNTAEKASLVVAKLVAGIAVAVVFIFFLFFAGMAAAYALSLWTGEAWSGFLIVAGLYMLLGLIVWSAKEKLIRIPVMNAIISQLFKEKEHNEKDQEH
jgi:hypothetical protein